jgi:anti-sigma B factor antagonist
MRTFVVRERTVRPGCRAVSIEGELDLSVAGRLQGALERVTAECDRVIVELEDCEFIDSTGIAVLIRAHLELERRGGRLLVCRPSDQVLRVLEVAGLTEHGFVVDSIGEALA